MPAKQKILLIQTAFPGDVVLTLPVAQFLARAGAEVHMVVTPRAADLLRNHPAVAGVIRFDKRGRDAGLLGLWRVARRARRERFDCAIVPHRSLRSAILAYASGAPRRIGFDRSAGRALLSDAVAYNAAAHEIGRNLALLGPLGIDAPAGEAPRLYPTDDDLRLVDGALAGWRHAAAAPLVAIAPGSVWNTKRWLSERFAALAGELLAHGCDVVLLGGAEDAELCRHIASANASDRVMSMAGQLSLLQSAAMLRRAALLVSNDSAPMHLAGAVGTPVVAIFGATAPSYGFGPTGPRDRVVETDGLACRPCAIHGGERCPIGTFDCMERITVGRVAAEVYQMLAGAGR